MSVPSDISYPEKADVGHPPISVSRFEEGARMRSHQATSGERVMAQVNGEHRIYTNPWNLKIFSFLTTDVEMSLLKFFIF